MDYSIKFENDASKEDIDFLSHSLMSYNTSKIGEQEFHSVSIILKNNNQQIIGGVTGTAVWGWLMVNYLWIDEKVVNAQLYDLLMAQIELEAIKYGVKKISISTIDPETKQIYENKGFEVNGILDDRPPGYTSYFLKKEKLSNHSINVENGLSIYTANDVSESDLKWLTNKIEEEQLQKLGEILYKDIRIFARDHSSKIIGGAKGYIGWGWFYLSTIWVDENYREKGLGSRLLQKAEEVALEHGINNVFLGTTEFQAREFYEKNGYEVYAISEDLPPGYKNFSMKKRLG